MHKSEETYITTLSMNEGKLSQAALVSREVAGILYEYSNVMLVKLPSYLPLE